MYSDIEFDNVALPNGAILDGEYDPSWIHYFGVTFSNYRVEELVRDGDRVVTAAHAARRRNEDGQWSLRQIEDVARALSRVTDHSRRFFDEIGVARSLNGVSTEARIRYTAATLAEPLESGLALAGALQGVEAALALAQQSTSTPDPELSAQAETLADRKSTRLNSSH